MTRLALFLALALTLAGCTPYAAAAAPTTAPKATAVPTSTAAPAKVHREVKFTATPLPYPLACTVSNTGGDVLNIRRAPSMTAAIVAGLLPGETATVTGRSGDWYEITGKHPGFVYRQYCK